MIVILQHVPYETPGWIVNWLEDNHMPYMPVDIYRGDALPEVKDISGLIIMGGAMNVYEENLYPWLATEKKFIAEAIRQKKKVLGVCLGAQLVAAALGARVKRNPALEIGWYPVDIAGGKLPAFLQGIFPEKIQTFHWHGDMFENPDGAKPFASSEACPNQGFVFGENVLALQFHLEITSQGMEDLMTNDAEDLLSESVFVQSAERIREGMVQMEKNRDVLFRLLNVFLLKDE